MKTSTAFYFLALAASAASSPLAELEDRTFFPPGCSTDNKVLIIGGLDQQFCSAYLQPTSTVTALNTVLNTAFATTTATQTVIVTSTSTPVPSLVCGVPGFAAADASTTFFNNDGSFTLEQCQAQCVSLAAETFASSSTLCACYAGSPNAVVVPAEGSPFTFYDIDCPVPSTLAKRAPVCAPTSAKVPPRFIQLIKASPARISSACSCLLNKQTPAACTIVKSATVSATTTILEVQTATVTETAVVTAA
ncbi:hypothetical protein IFR04_014889 [Cadophora malorum]|uniref:WSC domain-containing protein n=1 Tax=Cadophora malorum TaxID=108018 RepID=A0A8H7T423_9HELO|nr:hypothetical protein IFR04_014889 [Cadophora malorum]